MWACKRLDLSWPDWAFAMRCCGAPPAWSPTAERIARLWSPAGDALVCLGVRSAFDLYLRTRRWKAGDEIVFSGLTVPDMPEIARRHGLRAVPLDIDPATAVWRPEDLEKAIGPRTRALVLAHLFGTRADVTSALEVARPHGLAVIEDCAQAYAGPGWSGHPETDLAVFSFGSMKTATALGGALVRVRDPSTLAQMARLLACDPVQPTAEFCRRVLMAGVQKAASGPRAFGTLTALLEALPLDREQVLHGLTRSLPGALSLASLRQRPCAALLALLERRLSQGDRPVAHRAAAGQALFAALGDEVALPTRSADPHGYWMVPVRVRDGEALKRVLRGAGFDAMSGRLKAVRTPNCPTPGADALQDAVYLPFDPDMPPWELERLGALVTRFCAGEAGGDAGGAGQAASVPE